MLQSLADIVSSSVSHVGSVPDTFGVLENPSRLLLVTTTSRRADAGRVHP